MSAAITGKEWEVGNLFSREFVFRIPPYQRPYAWETEQAGELFDDLLAALRQSPSRSLDQAAPYFLGSIVVIKDNGEPDAEVVDGQQRLTTLTILLAALCSQAPEAYRSSIRGLLYDAADPLRGTPDRYRLELRREADFFRQHIQVEGALEGIESLHVPSLTYSQRNLVLNAQLLLDRVRGLPPDERARLAQYVTNRCLLVVVSTQNFEQAYRIFSVLNNRGLDLSHADVLKADALGALPETERENYALKWEQVEEDLGRDAFSALISHIRMIFAKRKLERSVIVEVRAMVQPQTRPKWFIDEVLQPYANALDIINNASHRSTGDASVVNGLLQWLARIDNSDWVPVALVVVSRWQARPDELRAALVALDRLASALMVCRADVNERISRYARVLSDLDPDRTDVETATKAMSLTEEEKRRTLDVVQGPLYLNQKVRAYVLLRLDAALADAVAPHGRPNPTVEHVLPQTPREGSKWLAWWRDDAEREQWTHRLGNLVLLTQRKNSQAQNFDFDEKKRRYFTTRGGVSDYPLTTKVLEETEWTPAVVERRQRELVEALRGLWSL